MLNVSESPIEPPFVLNTVSIKSMVNGLVSGVLLCFVTSIPVAIGLSAAMIIATAALVAIDASRLGRVDLKGQKRESAIMLFVGMLVMWIVVYPIAFFRRSAFVAPNLGFLSLFVAALSVSMPFVASMLIPARLPSCRSTEVVQLLEKVIRSSAFGASVKSIDGHRELSYDRDADVRHGECVAHLGLGDVPLKYSVEWQDGKKGLFQVRLLQSDLPSCSSAEVVKLLEKVIRGTSVGTATKSIDGHRELSYDSTAKVRHGECIAHTEAGDIPVKFIVTWQDQTKGLFQVRVLGSPD